MYIYVYVHVFAYTYTYISINLCMYAVTYLLKIGRHYEKVSLEDFVTALTS
jgi:hypothetical protein